MKTFRFDDKPLTQVISEQEASGWPSQWRDARRYECDPELRTALELAIELERPLLVTGEPGSGKTTAAYWAALKLGKRPPERDDAAGADEGVLHVQVRSSANERSIKYNFDAIGFFREMQLAGTEEIDRLRKNKETFCQKGPLWKAFESAKNVVLLFDEIDKAPPELPNDLLLELDRKRFEVPDLPGKVVAREDGDGARFLTLITSNGQRPLPDAFLRRCLHHRIDMDPKRMEAIVGARTDLELAADDLKLALAGFTAVLDVVKEKRLEHKPGLGELIDWVRAIKVLLDRKDDNAKAVRAALTEKRIDHRLPLQAVLKTSADFEKVLPSTPRS